MFLLSSLQAVTGAKPEHKIAKLADELEKVLCGHATSICIYPLFEQFIILASKLLKNSENYILDGSWFCLVLLLTDRTCKCMLTFPGLVFNGA